MGNVVCSSENNDELIDALRLLGYIKTKTVERVFRAVDRGDYILPSHRDNAYKDLSWKAGNIHISAPCVYSKVMEGLSLEPGLSFLNLGSGTGYLSTMVGLILNHHGTNHGVELNKDCIDYAYEKLEEFKQKSLALDEFDFCEPVFIHGNCLNLEQNRQYDRVYCGAACPENYELFIKQFVKIGGILVMPYKDHLLKIEKIDENTWKHKAMLPVSFASLIIPKIDDQSSLEQLPYSQPLSLQDLCRCSIRNKLRKTIWSQYPELETKNPIKTGVNKTQTQNSYPHYVVPLYENYETTETTNSDDDNEQTSRTHLLLYVDAHPDDDVTTLQVVRAMAPSRSSTNDTNLASTTTTTTTTAAAATTCNSNYFDTIDSDIDDDSSDLIESKEKKKNNNQLIKNKNRKYIYSLSDDSDDEEESSNDTPKKSKIIDDHGYLKFDNDSLRIANEYFQTTQNDDTLSIDDETTERLKIDRSIDNTDNNISDNIINNTNNINCDINNLHEQYESIAGQSNTNNNNNDKKNNILLSVNSSFNDSEDDHDDILNINKNINNDSDDEDNCPLMDWSTNTIKQKTKWGIPERMCNNDVNSYESSNSLSHKQQVFSHNVDINAFSYHMKNKISMLPLPMSLRLYINYNRVM